MKNNRKTTSSHSSGESRTGENVDFSQAKDGGILHASSELFSSIFFENPAAMVVSNTAGQIIYANANSHLLLGYSSEELIGLHIEQLVPEDARPAHAHSRVSFNKHPSGRSLSGRKLMARRKDGSLFPVEIGLKPLHTDEGILTLASIVDRTERQQIEEEAFQRANEVSLLYRLSVALVGGGDLYHALRAFVSELKKVMIVDSFHIGLYDAENDIFSYSLFINIDKDIQPPPRKLRERPGLTWEVISTRKTLYLSDVTDPQVKDQHNIVWVMDAPIHAYLGIPLMLQERVIGIMSVQAIQPNAYSLNQIRLLETIAAQVAMTIEKLNLLDQLKRELADRKRAEAELKDREEILEVVAAAANTFLKTSQWQEDAWEREVNRLLEKLGSATNASHAFIYETSLNADRLQISMRYEWTMPGIKSDLNDPAFSNLIVEEDKLENWKACLTRGLPYIGDAKHLSQEGQTYLKQFGIQAVLEVPIFIDDTWWGIIGFDEVRNPRNWSNAEIGALILAGNLLGAAVKRRQMDDLLQNELDQRKTLIEELGIKNAELERFTYTVSHDLRSPLVTIQGFLGYLQKSASEGNLPAFHKDYERISRATLRMDRLLKDLLELSRIGRVLNKQSDLPFETLAREAAENVHGRLQQGNIALRIGANLPIIRGDKPRLIEVLQNLIDNAAKYMGNQTEPLIEIGQRGVENRQAVLYVKDNGIGIAAEYHDRIFRLFDKLDPSSEGTGVGLALVKQIIEFHGGRIWIESRPGNGSTFCFTLPLKAD